MVDRLHTLVYIWQILIAGILITAIVFLLTLIPSGNGLGTAQAKGSQSSQSPLSSEMSASPNVITSGGAVAMHKLGQSAKSTSLALNGGAQTVASTATQGSKAVARGASSAARGLGSGIFAVGRTAGKGIGFVGNAIGRGVVAVITFPSKALGAVSETSVVRTVIRPSDQIEDVPIIDPNSPELRSALVALPPEAGPQTAPQSNQGPAWPMHGAVTTNFGVPHRPYQHTHSGLDISDGQRSGVTPIKPFRPGRVIDTVYSAYGLGNHITVDHGNGVTSVYAHLASISVHVGQEVDMNTTLGTEGSTGASTGTHLHFEIRVNGKAADPHQFISGQP